MDDFMEIIRGIMGILIFVGIGFGIYKLAKHRGRDPIRFIFLSLFFLPFVVFYLSIVKTKTKGVGEDVIQDNALDLFDALKRISGVEENTARAILNEFPDERSLRISTTEELEQVHGVEADTARAIKYVYRNESDEREALLETLTDIPQMSDRKARALLDQYPTEESIQAATIEQLTNIPGIGTSIATAIKARLG